MDVEVKPLAEVTRRAFEVLSRELGAADTARFIRQFTTGFGDYTKERDALFGGRSLDQVLTEIRRGSPAGAPNAGPFAGETDDPARGAPD